MPRDKAPKKRRNPLVQAIGICAGVTIGGMVVKVRRPHRFLSSLNQHNNTPFFLFFFSPPLCFHSSVFARPVPRSIAVEANPETRHAVLCFASDPRSQHLNDGGKITLPARRRTVEVVLKSGETIGELVCTYVGEYTQENLDQVQRMNRGVLDDLDFVQPGEASKKSKPRSLARSLRRALR